jgi:hypothetical protein
MEAATQSEVAEAAAFANHAAHIASFAPASFMPPRVPPLATVSVFEWRDSFTDLLYRLHDLLSEDNIEETASIDFAHARLVFMIAREVRALRRLRFCFHQMRSRLVSGT